VRRIAEPRGDAVAGESGTVRGAARQLESVLENLLDNAERHGGRANVVLGVADAHCIFAVIDDGPGIAAADLPQVFDRFFTTDRRRGTGLGLALARSIVRAHGGTIEVESRAGHTAFNVRLPAALD
ncbi:MAG: HAMP domain-containing histidine kinase, partial [Deltaproteobacteria bacterium]|nr:HAMP domain-containing histidine kinase [Nannocystaceae bacterium]